MPKVHICDKCGEAADPFNRDGTWRLTYGYGSAEHVHDGIRHGTSAVEVVLESVFAVAQRALASAEIDRRWWKEQAEGWREQDEQHRTELELMTDERDHWMDSSAHWRDLAKRFEARHKKILDIAREAL